MERSGILSGAQTASLAYGVTTDAQVRPTDHALSAMLDRFERMLVDNAALEERTERAIGRIIGEPPSGGQKEPSSPPFPSSYEQRFDVLLNIMGGQVNTRHNQMERLESFI